MDRHDRAIPAIHVFEALKNKTGCSATPDPAAGHDQGGLL
jgi:hypothetical protein